MEKCDTNVQQFLVNEFDSWLDQLGQQSYKANHRHLLVLSGNSEWANKMAQRTFLHFQQSRILPQPFSCVVWGNGFSQAPDYVVSNYRHQLGGENHLVIYADEHFHPDAFAALSGTVVSGGLMVWMCSSELINDKNNFFVQRFLSKIRNSQKTYILTENINQLPLLTSGTSSNDNSEGIDEKCSLLFSSFKGCVTGEQEQAVSHILTVATGHRKRPLVLTADRGRGKSSALAIASAHYMMTTNLSASKIIITAPHSDALTIFFKQLLQCCPEGMLRKTHFSYHSHSVEFVPVDVLLRSKPSCHMLLVDEAAGIPVAALSTLVGSYHRVVFSSTQHGYEGAGRGFATKFTQALAVKSPNYRNFHIHQPIRWNDTDPLERLIFDGFLLNVTSDEILATDDELTNLIFRQVEQTELFTDETLLKQVFSVLITAHYQTTPSDLKLLLNHDSISIVIAQLNGVVVAVSLNIFEGLASEKEVKQIENSTRRLKDHFIPQSLLIHSQCTNAFSFRYLRIMRIAVLPHYQHQGIGLRLIDKVKLFAQANNVSIVGTSFGASAQLMTFWHRAKFSLVRLGNTIDKASGEYSALMLQPISNEGSSFVTSIQQPFYRQLSFLLNTQHEDIAPAVVTQIIRYWPNTMLPVLTAHDNTVVTHFINKKSLYKNCAFSLNLWIINAISTLDNCEKYQREINLLIYRVLQNHSISDTCIAFGFIGKKQLNQLVINAVDIIKRNMITAKLDR